MRVLYVLIAVLLFALPGCHVGYGVVRPHHVVYTSHTPHYRVHTTRETHRYQHPQRHRRHHHYRGRHHTITPRSRTVKRYYRNGRLKRRTIRRNY